MEPDFAESLHGDELDEPIVEKEAEEQPVEDPEPDRDAVEAAYQSALSERNASLTKCLAIQNKLSDYFKRKQTDENKNPENQEDLDVKYHQLIRLIDEVNAELADQRGDYEEEIGELENRKSFKVKSVSDEWESLIGRKREISKKCTFARSGRKILQKELDQMEELERRKNDELCLARLEFIKLKNKKESRDRELQQREQLGEGLHLIDYEQLKIENQTYNEKVEERNEDLLKFRAKISSTVQVLTHLKEKLFFVSNQNAKLTEEKDEIEKESNLMRDRLGKAKLARSKVHRENTSLQSNMGLLGKMDLLYDFEDQIESTKDYEPRLASLKQRYANLGKENKLFKKKIESIKAEN